MILEFLKEKKKERNSPVIFFDGGFASYWIILGQSNTAYQVGRPSSYKYGNLWLVHEMYITKTTQMHVDGTFCFSTKCISKGTPKFQILNYLSCLASFEACHIPICPDYRER